MPTRRSGQNTSGRQQQGRQRGSQADVAGHQSQTHADRNQRDTEGGQ